MKKKILGLAICFGVIMLAAGCKGKDTSNTATSSDASSVKFTPPDFSKYVTLGDYMGLPLEKVSVEVTDEDVEAYVNEVLQSYAEPDQITDRAVANGDTVDINYKGLINGEEFQGGSAENSPLLIGSGQLIEGFEEGLVGVMPGESVSLDLTFPEVYENAPDLAGQSVVFEVQVNFIHGEEVIVPELTDEWVASNTDLTTAAELRETVKNQLTAEAEQNAMGQERAAISEQVIQNASVSSIPPERVEAEVQLQNNYNTMLAQSFGMTLPEYITAMQETEETYQARIQATAEESAKTMMIFMEIARQEKITLTGDEREEMSRTYGYTDYQQFIETHGQDTVEEVLLQDKVLNFLMDNAEIQ